VGLSVSAKDECSFEQICFTGWIKRVGKTGMAENIFDLIRKISCANHHKQLVLKNPPNMARIRYILSMFPDAKFVYIQRDAFDTYASNKKMVQMIFRKYALGKIVDVDPGHLILDSYAMMADLYHRDKLLIPPAHLCEISYEKFVADPVECMETIYEQLQLGDFSFCQQAMCS
jgi:hypothetical protein